MSIGPATQQCPSVPLGNVHQSCNSGTSINPATWRCLLVPWLGIVRWSRNTAMSVGSTWQHPSAPQRKDVHHFCDLVMTVGPMTRHCPLIMWLGDVFQFRNLAMSIGPTTWPCLLVLQLSNVCRKNKGKMSYAAFLQVKYVITAQQTRPLINGFRVIAASQKMSWPTWELASQLGWTLAKCPWWPAFCLSSCALLSPQWYCMSSQAPCCCYYFDRRNCWLAHPPVYWFFCGNLLKPMPNCTQLM